jgi:hypothetical protein
MVEVDAAAVVRGAAEEAAMSGIIEGLASHAENLDYYRKMTTEELARFLPQAQADVAETSMRLEAVLAVLAERGIT